MLMFSKTLIYFLNFAPAGEIPRRRSRLCVENTSLSTLTQTEPLPTIYGAPLFSIIPLDFLAIARHLRISLYVGQSCLYSGQQNKVHTL